MANFRHRFDGEARTYDQRVGLKKSICQAAFRGLVSLSKLQPDDVVVEIGVGSGQISQWLSRGSATYLGMDVSLTMLETSRRRVLPDTGRSLFLQADCNRSWPIADGCARLVFGSRSCHLLRSSHVVSEVARLLHPDGGAFITGCVVRASDSIQEQAKSVLRRSLRRAGWSARNRERSGRDIVDRLVHRGAVPLGPLVVGAWQATTSPNAVLSSWRRRSGLAGLDLPAAVKDQQLASVEDWALQAFGDLNTALTSRESYVLSGVRFFI